MHCNLNPSAIVISDADRRARFPVTVNDWASARTFDSTTPPPLSTPARLHQSPEQRAGGTIDERTDIFALGVIGFRALNGVYPEAGMLPLGAPPVLAALVAQMIAEDPAARPTATEVRSSSAFIASTLRELADREASAPRKRADTDLDSLVDRALQEVVDDPSNGVPELIGPRR